MTPAPRPPRVVILTASYGAGHNRVAEALAREFRRAGASTMVVDHFHALVHPRFAAVSQALYGRMLRRTPTLWRLAYWWSDRLRGDSPLLLGANRLGASRLARLLDAVGPDHVVSVHPTPAAALTFLARAGRRLPSHTAVLTDFAAHGQWLSSHVDRFCAPADEVAAGLIRRGVPPARVRVTGIPVDDQFAQPRDRAAVRRALGWTPRDPLVLIMAGSSGSLGRLEEATGVAIGLEPPCQVVAVTGRDDDLRRRLLARSRHTGERLRVLGYADNVRDLMAAADAIVTKAGAVTLAEALAAELPAVCFGSLAGHEARNERFVVGAGAALEAQSPDALARMLRRLLGDSRLLHGLRERMRALRRPEAAGDVVHLVLGSGRLLRERAS
jgi:processive 1,2-diacylglycerol beta-glucosyltransferase